MQLSEIIGTIGVTLILAGYFFNLKKVISESDLSYFLLNFIGAVLACISSVMIAFYPFVVLEGIWALVSFIPLIRRIRN